MKIIQKPDMRRTCNVCGCVIEIESSDIIESKGHHHNTKIVKCPICGSAIRVFPKRKQGFNNDTDSNEDDGMTQAELFDLMP